MKLTKMLRSPLTCILSKIKLEKNNPGPEGNSNCMINNAMRIQNIVPIMLPDFMHVTNYTMFRDLVIT